MRMLLISKADKVLSRHTPSHTDPHAQNILRCMNFPP
jgi:hypothetical protein